MKDELFTMMPEIPAMSPEMLARLQEETRRNFLRMKHFSEMLMSPKEPAVGSHPGGTMVSLTTRMGASGTLRPEALIAEALRRSSVEGAVTHVTRTGLRPEGDA